MPLMDKPFLQYLESHSEPEPSLLHQLRRETHQQMSLPQMLTDPVQGQLLRLLSGFIRPRRVLEVGSFTGYSCLCLAEGLAEGGHIFTIELQPERASRIQRYLALAGLEQQATLLIGDGKELIPTIEGEFDLVFLDADKAHYPQYYELLMPRIVEGGWMIADNVLWHGKVLEAPADKETAGIQAFNDMAAADPATEVLMLPMRDGLSLIRKKAKSNR